MEYIRESRRPPGRLKGGSGGIRNPPQKGLSSIKKNIYIYIYTYVYVGSHIWQNPYLPSHRETHVFLGV